MNILIMIISYYQYDDYFYTRIMIKLKLPEILSYMQR